MTLAPSLARSQLALGSRELAYHASSRTRSIAGLAGFLTLIQHFDRPERYGRSRSLEDDAFKAHATGEREHSRPVGLDVRDAVKAGL
jgi:hypothetical protein